MDPNAKESKEKENHTIQFLIFLQTGQRKTFINKLYIEIEGLPASRSTKPNRARRPLARRKSPALQQSK
jgi:hypothetical protein